MRDRPRTMDFDTERPIDISEDTMPARKRQPQHSQPTNDGGLPSFPATHVERLLCVAGELRKYLPRRLRAPAVLPNNVPTPELGEHVYLTPSSPWIVAKVAHHWDTQVSLKIEVWLEPDLGEVPERTHFALTQ